MSSYPKFFRVRQTFELPHIEGLLPAVVESELRRLELSNRVRGGQHVAIAAGSRGIAQIGPIVHAVAQHFLSLGARPFVVPAMGSHGGGTAEGQQRILKSYDITEESCGCPIRASMDTVVIDQAAEGFPIHFDRIAFEADHIFLCSRVKPHTTYVGRVESGFFKMLVVGLGKQIGAKNFHRAIQEYGFERIVLGVGRRVLERCPILGGLAIVENAYSEIAHLEAVRPTDFEAREHELLKLAKQWMPRLPFSDVHILIIDEIGKNISGTGMDTNVVGRKCTPHAPREDVHHAERDEHTVRRIIVRGLTAASHGSAHGVGLADFCKTRLVRQADQQATWVNGLTSGAVSLSAFPLHFETDRELLDATLPIIGMVEPANAKILWIKNTLDLAEVECSAPYLDEARKRTDLEILTKLRDLRLDADGNLPDFK